MDPRLEKALEFSNYHKILTTQKETLKEKTIKNMLIGYNGGMFRVDRNLMCFVKMMIDSNRKIDIPILDLNDNPILIENLEDFWEVLITNYLKNMNEYYLGYKKIKEQRSAEKMLEI